MRRIYLFTICIASISAYAQNPTAAPSAAKAAPAAATAPAAKPTQATPAAGAQTTPKATDVAPSLPSSTWETPKSWPTNPNDIPPPPVAKPPPTIEEKAKALCSYVETCVKSHPGKSALCVKNGLKESAILDHVLEGDTAKDLSRFLRKEGFLDREHELTDFKQLPEGAILVLDAHDPVKDKRPACPKVYGNVLVKCGDKWVDDYKNDLDFHMKRGCRTKGIWLHTSMKLSLPIMKTRKRLITDPQGPPPPAAPEEN